jgi:hypothetical protein
VVYHRERVRGAVRAAVRRVERPRWERDGRRVVDLDRRERLVAWREAESMAPWSDFVSGVYCGVS